MGRKEHFRNEPQDLTEHPLPFSFLSSVAGMFNHFEGKKKVVVRPDVLAGPGQGENGEGQKKKIHTLSVLFCLSEMN